MTSLTVLREQDERRRFGRLYEDDHRTAIPDIDAQSLERDLRRAVEGEVRFDKGSRALYATDASNYRQVPIGVVIPRHKPDVMATVDLCRKYGAPILSRGGGTSLSGQCCNVAVVMDFTKYMHHVIDIDPQRRLARVEPGCVLDNLQLSLRQYGLIFGPDPATHNYCVFGGMLGNNSCGIHSLMSQNNGLGLRVSDNTHELEVLTYEGERLRVGATPPDELERIIAAGGRRGELYRRLRDYRDKWADEIRRSFPKLGRRVSGYNVDDLLPENNFHVARALVGSEGTLATYLEATMILVPDAKSRSLLILGYPDVFVAADHVAAILECQPIGLEGIDERLVEFVNIKGALAAAARLLPEGNGWLYVEFGGDTQQDADDQARRCMEALRKQPNAPSVKLFTDREEQHLLWELREAGLGSTAFVRGSPDTWPGWEDSAVPVEKTGPYLRELRHLFDRYDYKVSTYGHFGQGIVHCRIPFDLYTQRGIDRYRQFMEEATDLCNKYGGSFSGEHGDGQARGMYLPKMFGQRMVEGFREFKRIWDPQWKMNPGKVIDAYSITENLRLSPDYNPPRPPTHFEYPDDHHQFSRAVLRCVGVGKCRRMQDQTMCPSYMVTREEMHSTRGRARLLWEMLNGEVLDEGWKSEAVHEALDLCLACKGCKGDCPVNVDMATYKAEFYSHYYEKKIRPRHMFAFGWIAIWARLASYAPTLINMFTQTPGLSAIAKWMAGMDQRRRIPPFASQTFQEWFRGHQPKNPNGQPVILFPDTFNNYFHPETAIAAVEVLEDAGFRVRVPQQNICCGRPLYDYGFLNMAKRWLLDIIQKLEPEIEAGVPIVLLEPSCWSTFYDELTNILAGNKHADRLHQQIYLFSTFLKDKAPNYHPPALHRKALLHKHCHHKSELQHTPDHEQQVLRDMGLEVREPSTGCCGMAGAFGYTAGEHTDVAIKCGQRVLIPEVEKAGDDEVIVADGFSCREQISQMSDREALHLAEVIQLARQDGAAYSGAQRPEAGVVESRQSAQRVAKLKVAGMVGAGMVAGGALMAMLRASARTRDDG